MKLKRSRKQGKRYQGIQNKHYERKRGRTMIKITLKNGCVCKWKRKEYTDYKYDGRCFIVIRDKRWVGIYNLDSIISVTVK